MNQIIKSVRCMYVCMYVMRLSMFDRSTCLCTYICIIILVALVSWLCLSFPYIYLSIYVTCIKYQWIHPHTHIPMWYNRERRRYIHTYTIFESPKPKNKTSFLHPSYLHTYIASSIYPPMHLTHPSFCLNCYDLYNLFATAASPFSLQHRRF